MKPNKNDDFEDRLKRCFISFAKKKKEDLNKQFFFSTKFIDKECGTIFYKAINRKGKFVWIDKYGFPAGRDDSNFYLTIIADLNQFFNERLISSSFNMFRSREEFYNQYSFVKEVKKRN